jgi:2-keto-4-pentenoate hydratase/2-oxohepta-3-ene-1,7-dioic acid hydratase in catechol pathway
MPIVNAVIKSQINALTTSLNSGDVVNKDPDATIDEFTQGLADIIEAAIKSATITIPPGTIITTGSPATQTQSVPGIVNNGIS